MPRHWEIFPARPWPRGFGLRFPERPPAPPYNPDQLELSFALDDRPRDRTPTEQLRDVYERSRLPASIFAPLVFGCADDTLARWMRGDRMPECRRHQAARLESVTVHRDRIVVTLKAPADLDRRPRRRRARSR